MFEEIKDLLIEVTNVEVDEIAENARLKEDLGINSLYAVEMVLGLETKYDIMFEYEEIQNLILVRDVVEIVEKKLKEKK